MLKYYLILFFFISCIDDRRDNERVRSEGEFNSVGTETGKWKYYSTSNELLEEGDFENGIRVGLWRYYFPRQDSILWMKYNDSGIRISTNVPDFLNLHESSDRLISFKNKDTSKVFNLVIGKNYSNSFSTYKSLIYDELRMRNVFLIDSACHNIETANGSVYMYNFINGRDIKGGEFYIFNIIGLSKEKNLIEVSLRCDEEYENKGRKVFFSVLPNLFIDSTRFINEREDIVEFKSVK